MPDSEFLVFTNSEFGAGTAGLVIWLDEVDCHGSESKLLDCDADTIRYHNCEHTEDAGVSCHINGKCLMCSSNANQ